VVKGEQTFLTCPDGIKRPISVAAWSLAGLPPISSRHCTPSVQGVRRSASRLETSYSPWRRSQPGLGLRRTRSGSELRQATLATDSSGLRGKAAGRRQPRRYAN
jgi:hypothetical protein